MCVCVCLCVCVCPIERVSKRVSLGREQESAQASEFLCPIERVSKHMSLCVCKRESEQARASRRVSECAPESENT